MSSNKGKDGEMRVAKLISDIAINQDGLDFTRTTITNESDMGADFVLKSTPESIDLMLNVAIGTPRLTSGKENASTTTMPSVIETRIDVKTTSGKITKSTVTKFASDVRKHPGCTVHILMGGDSLSKPAKIEFNEHAQTFEEDGKILVYIANDGVIKLEDTFSKNLSLPPQNKEEE